MLPVSRIRPGPSTANRDKVTAMAAVFGAQMSGVHRREYGKEKGFLLNCDGSEDAAFLLVTIFNGFSFPVWPASAKVHAVSGKRLTHASRGLHFHSLIGRSTCAAIERTCWLRLEPQSWRAHRRRMRPMSHRY